MLFADTTEEEFQAIFERLKDRKKKDDEQKELLSKQNVELQKKVVKVEKQVEKETKKTILFKNIVEDNQKELSELEKLKKQHTAMKIALEASLNFIIPSQLRIIIENTLKEIK